MNTPWDIITEIESDNGKIFKQNVIEREASAGNDDFFVGLKYGLHPLWTFGMKQVPFSTVKSSNTQELDFSYFIQLCEELKARNLTGYAARDAVYDAMLTSGQEQWDNWFRRILIQDMRAGFSVKTVNKAVKDAKTPEYSIPVFSCMLAHDGTKHEKKIVGKKQVDVKLDGVRVLTILNGETVTQYSRNGKELKNFAKVKDQLFQMSIELEQPMVLDGEIMSSSFQDLMTQVNRLSDVNADDSVLNVFDIIPLSEFEAGVSSKTQTERTRQLMDLKTVHKDWDQFFPNVNFLGSEVVDLDTLEGKARMAEINKKAIDGGYEGIMMKDVDALYYSKRSYHWLKMKPYIEMSLPVVHLEEGTGKHKGRLGAIHCKGVDDGVEISVSVGSGLSDKQREDFWANQDEITGQIIEIKADAVTQNRDGTYSLRFPRFIRFRGFEKGEKI